jgi:RNA polymerase sigma factor (sigma-70 family)
VIHQKFKRLVLKGLATRARVVVIGGQIACTFLGSFCRQVTNRPLSRSAENPVSVLTKLDTVQPRFWKEGGMYRHSEWTPLLAGCIRQIGTWRAPPNWSRSDWLKQVRSLAASAAWEALSHYDPSRGVPLDAFLRLSVMAAVRTQYRQEWVYALRFLPQANGPEPDSPKDRSLPSVELHESLREILAKLSPADRWVMSQFFWQGATEAEVARNVGVSQPAMSKRKARIIESLRRSLSV